MNTLFKTGLLLGFVPFLANAQETNAIDSSYHNWYYESRQDFYNQLVDMKYDVVFLGNSITERGYWQELIGPKIAVANRGIGGDNTFGVLARLESIVQLRPKKIFLMIGINDIGRGLSQDIIISNYRKILEYLQGHLPQTRIYLQSVLPLHEELLSYDYLKGKNPLVTQLNQELEKLARTSNIEYVDLHPIFSLNGKLRAEYTTDGIHLNPLAYSVWVNELKRKKHL